MSTKHEHEFREWEREKAEIWRQRQSRNQSITLAWLRLERDWSGVKTFAMDWVKGRGRGSWTANAKHKAKITDYNFAWTPHWDTDTKSVVCVGRREDWVRAWGECCMKGMRKGTARGMVGLVGASGSGITHVNTWIVAYEKSPSRKLYLCICIRMASVQPSDALSEIIEKLQNVIQFFYFL